MRSLILALPADASLDDQTLLRFALARQTQAGQAEPTVQSRHDLQDPPSAGLDAQNVWLRSAVDTADHARVGQLPPADELVLVLPAQRLSWQRLDLPRVPRARLPQALAGLLEERLLSDPAQLHFAVAPDAAPGQPTWVAVCDKAWLKQALQFFETAGRPVSRVVPQTAPLAAGLSARWQALGQPGAAWLLRSADDGVQCLPFDALAAEWLRVEAAATQAEPALAAWAEQLAGAPVAVCSPAQSLLQAAQSPWNLAQFDLALRNQRWLSGALRHWQVWRAAPAWRPLRWGLLACVLVQVVGLNVWAWQERADLQAKQAALGQLLNRHFPALPVVDPVLQMQRELSALQRATSALAPDDLEALLSAVAREAPDLPAATGLSYQAQSLTLHGLDLPPDAAASLTDRLARAGYRGDFTGNTLRVQLQLTGTAEAAP